MVLKELICNSLYFRGCGGLERTDILTVSTLERCSNGPERKDSLQLLLLEGMVVLKEQII